MFWLRWQAYMPPASQHAPGTTAHAAINTRSRSRKHSLMSAILVSPDTVQLEYGWKAWTET